MIILTSFYRQRLRALMLLFAVFAFFASSVTRADVYQDRPYDPNQLAGLSELLPQSLRPGGTRRISINNSSMMVTRHVVKDRDQLMRALTHDMEIHFNNYPERGFDYDRLEQLIAEGEDKGKAASVAVVENLVQAERDRIRTALELPFSYTAGNWRVVARVPITALDPENPLAETPVTDGYLLFTEAEPERLSYTDIWELKFQPDFNLLRVFGSATGDAAGDDPAFVTRLPNARRTLTYEESADHWYAKTWSYEAPGSTDTAFKHYLNQLEQAGFRSRLSDVGSPTERMAFLRRDDQEIVVHVLDTGIAPRPVQITIQRYPVQ